MAKNLAALAHKHALNQLAKLMQAPHSPFSTVGGGGFLRGIDFYKASLLPFVVADSFAMFYRAHGKFPDLIAPAGFNEKVVWRKFFDRIKTPESGDKLVTYKSIPPEYRDDVKTAKVVWSSAIPRLPDNSQIPPGGYFLKSNHGSGMNRKINYPLSRDDFESLCELGNKWLRSRYGLKNGEWWYNTFEKRIFIEELIADGNVFSINFFVFNGQVGLVVFYDNVTGETITLGSDLSVIHHKNKSRELETICSLELIARMKEVSSLIGREAAFVRVDFFLNDNSDIFLGEITLTPGNGLSKRPDGVDEYLGKLWLL